jgi:hypothetical protein
MFITAPQHLLNKLVMPGLHGLRKYLAFTPIHPVPLHKIVSVLMDLGMLTK